MATSQNGWPASPDLHRRTFAPAGVEYLGGIVDDDDVETVLGYVLTQVAERVERPRNPGCWGFAFRQNRNGSDLSNHSSGTAVDHNAPEHPNGVSTARTFSQSEINEIHQILSEVAFVVRWGGDYRGTPDSMHFEINAGPAQVARVAQDIREEDDMKAEDWDRLNKRFDDLEKRIDGQKLDVGKPAKWADDTVAKTILERLDTIGSRLAALEKRSGK